MAQCGQLTSGPHCVGLGVAARGRGQSHLEAASLLPPRLQLMLSAETSAGVMVAVRE